MVSVSERVEKRWPRSNEIAVELRVVVDFAVQHHPQAAVFVRKRLMPAGDVDDAQAAESQANSRADEDAFIVRAAMDDGFRHAVHELFGDLASLVEFKNAANAAHGVSSIRYWLRTPRRAASSRYI